MRAFLVIALAVTVAWTGYLVSPYWSAWQLASALEARDPRRIEQRVNLRAVRQSLARQLIAEGLQSKAVSAALGSPDPQAAAGTIAAAADPLLAQIVTPEGLIAVLPRIKTAEGARGGSKTGIVTALGDVWSFLLASRWRGFRNVYLTLPPDTPSDRQVRLQLRLSRFAWRLVAVDLPPETRVRLLGDMLRQQGAAIPVE